MRAMIADDQRRVVDQALLLVDEAGGVAGDERGGGAGRGQVADRVHRVLGRRCGAPVRRGRSWRRRPCAEARREGGAADDPVDRFDPALEGGELGGAGLPVDGDGDRLGDVARVVRFEVLVGLVGGLAGRHRFGAGAGQRRPQQRRRGGQQQRRAGQGDARPGGASPRAPAGTSRRTRRRRPGRGGSRGRRSGSRAGPAARGRRGSRSPRRAPRPRRRRRPSSRGSAAA